MGSNHMHELFRNSNHLTNNSIGIGERKTVRGNEFRNGLCCSKTFSLGEAFQKDIRLSDSSLKFVLSSDLYYEKEVIRTKGQSLSYHGQSKAWDKNLSEGKAKVFFNISDVANIIDCDLINDGNGNYGKECVIELVATYEI